MRDTPTIEQCAKSAAKNFDSIVDNSGEYLFEDAVKLLLKEFKPIAELQALLVELASITSKGTYWMMDNDRVSEILAHPLVAAAIKEEK